MSIERYMEITQKLRAEYGPSAPAYPTTKQCVEAEQMVSELVAMNAKEIGIDPDELEGAIGLARDHFRLLVRAKI